MNNLYYRCSRITRAIHFATDQLNCLEAYNVLNEVTHIDYDSGTQNDKFYHFYGALEDLLVSLSNKSIVSAKNVRAAKFDLDAHQDEAYVCMTKGATGKEHTIAFEGAPVGISFKDLAATCTNRAYRLGGPHSEVLTKTKYVFGRDGKTPTTSGKTSTGIKLHDMRDFNILGVGKYKDAQGNTKYFLSGGEGLNLMHHYISRPFTDEKLYNTFHELFTRTLAQPKTGQRIFQFKDNTFGEPIQYAMLSTGQSQIPINTSAQQNKNYIPWIDTKQVDGVHTNHSATSFKPTVWNHAKFTFEEIIGVGPIMVTDEEGAVIFRLDLVSPTNRGGYQSPDLFSQNITTGVYADTSYYFSPSRSDTDKVNLVMDKEIADALCKIYDEGEYRVYIPQKKDMRFNASDIATIVLPAVYKTDTGFSLNLNKLVQVIAEETFKFDTNSKDILLQQLRANKLTSNRKMPDKAYKTILTLINLLTSEYNGVTVEIYDKLPAKSKISVAFDQDETTTDSLNIKEPKKHIRNVLDNIWPIAESGSEGRYNGESSVKAEIPIDDDTILARIGAEVVVIAEDENKQKYVLIVKNAHKSSTFFELPGGGLAHLPITPAAFEEVALHRLKFKCGIEREDLAELKDSGKALLLSEKATEKSGALTKDFGVDWSYYRLYLAKYKHTLLSTDLDYTHDNTVQATIENRKGYIAYLDWLPVKSLSLTRAFSTRYANIINLIKSL